MELFYRNLGRVYRCEMNESRFLVTLQGSCELLLRSHPKERNNLIC